MYYTLTSVEPLPSKCSSLNKTLTFKMYWQLIDNFQLLGQPYFSKPKQMKEKRDTKTTKYKVILQVHPYEDMSYRF